MDNINHYNFNLYKCKDYTINFYKSNFENNLDTTILSIGKEGKYLNSGYIYNNINDNWQYLIL